MPNLLPAFTIFALGCLLIHIGRAYARATTVLLSATALMLSLTLGSLLCHRLGLPSGSAEAGALYWPAPDRTDR
ncbi:hypothetical protein [Methylobacterium sp. NEAU K]|uniref:hypothetical protein n=1 Tax=Methylobacterium sp. NEAU K TaxID=3064946 RepID=UPI0027336CFA|nr:hypothetical protein [Methylobacterium sp. NEAU K]MDP4004571.1 hypothetical protein [Methylobacterium sp. NEAU K]